jgi:hypothetical protein
LGFFDGLKVKVRRDYRQMGEGPFSAGGPDARGDSKFKEVPHCGGQNILVTLEIIVVFLEAPKSLGNIAGYGGLFGNDERLTHVVQIKLLTTVLN